MSLLRVEGCLAYSLAGHDKGKLYVVSKNDMDMIYLVDGNLKKIDNPKKKNKKHIQIVKKDFRKILDEDANISLLVTEDKNFTNDNVKRAIKLFLKKEEED